MCDGSTYTNPDFASIRDGKVPEHLKPAIAKYAIAQFICNKYHKLSDDLKKEWVDPDLACVPKEKIFVWLYREIYGHGLKLNRTHRTSVVRFLQTKITEEIETLKHNPGKKPGKWTHLYPAIKRIKETDPGLSIPEAVKQVMLKEGYDQAFIDKNHLLVADGYKKHSARLK